MKKFYCKISTSNLASKSDIPNFVKKRDFYRNKLNELSKKIKAITTKELTKYLINKFSILNGAKYSSSGIFKNYLLFIPGKKIIKYFRGTTQIDLWKSNGISKENIKISLDQTAILQQLFFDYHLLPDTNFNLHCLINNIYILKK